jgi:hypothetical protein
VQAIFHAADVDSFPSDFGEVFEVGRQVNTPLLL